MTYEQQLERLETLIAKCFGSVENTLESLAEELSDLQSKGTSYNLVLDEPGWPEIVMYPKHERHDEDCHLKISYILHSGKFRVLTGFNDSDIEKFIRKSRYNEILTYTTELYKRYCAEKKNIEVAILEEDRTMRALQNSVKCDYT